MTSETRCDVLVVGAGPTGLFLALLLAKLGIAVRIVDSADAPGTTSRALAVQARTLEFYRQVGLADDVLARGLVFGKVCLWRGSERVASVDLSNTGEGLSPYPYGVIFPQDAHERLLIEHLEREGVVVERGITIDGIEKHGEAITARGSGRTYQATYVAGCDGARSVIRRAIGVEFPGGTYEHVFYVADITGRGALLDKALHVVLDHEGFLALFPLAAEGAARLIGTVRVPLEGKSDLSWNDIDRTPIDRIGLEIDHVNWFSTYRVHHRVADSFRRGSVFLLGDAAHIHSPVGGQGMNTVSAMR